MAPSLLAIITPIIVGLILGVGGIIGMLVGGLACGFAVAIMMANAGGAWDNAKKYIEAGNLGGKGSDNHKATVVGDTVGDPFKDTSGPSLNILIKLMSMVAVVVAGLTVSYAPTIQFYFGFNPTEISYKEEFNKRLSAREVTLPSLTEAPGAAKSSSIFEDPLMGTEDIYLPNEDDAAASIQTPKVPEVKPGEVKPLPTDTTPASTDKPADSGFSSGFDEKPADKPADKPAEGGFSGGFDAIEDKPADKPAEGGFSGGFDVIDEKKEEPAAPATGFDAIAAPADEKPADEPKEEPANEEPKTTSEGSGGFEGM